MGGSELPASLNLHRCCPMKLCSAAYMQFDCADLGQRPASWQTSNENAYFSFHTCHQPSWLSSPFCGWGNEAQSSEATWLRPLCRPVPDLGIKPSPHKQAPGAPPHQPAQPDVHKTTLQCFWEDILGGGLTKSVDITSYIFSIIHLMSLSRSFRWHIQHSH